MQPDHVQCQQQHEVRSSMLSAYACLVDDLLTIQVRGSAGPRRDGDNDIIYTCMHGSTV